MALGRLWLRVPESMKFVFHGRPRPWVTGKDLILKVIGEIGVDGARYGAMEFCGDTLTHLTMDERFSSTNMAVEAGAKNGIMALDEGLVQIFLDAGAAFSTSTCGPCIGGHMGVLADGEVCVSTSSRNFVGRMGHRGSKVYLSNAAVAAAAAVAGKLVHPDEVVRDPVRCRDTPCCRDVPSGLRNC